MGSKLIKEKVNNDCNTEDLKNKHKISSSILKNS